MTKKNEPVVIPISLGLECHCEERSDVAIRIPFGERILTAATQPQNDRFF